MDIKNDVRDTLLGKSNHIFLMFDCLKNGELKKSWVETQPELEL